MNVRDEIENAGWTSIDNLMDLYADVIYKFTEKSDITPDEMRKYTEKQMDTIFSHARKIRREKDVQVRELSADVRLP